MYMLSCSSICVYHFYFFASYVHCVHMYVCTFCAVSDIYMYKHNERDSVCLCLMHVFYMNRLSFIFH